MGNIIYHSTIQGASRDFRFVEPHDELTNTLYKIFYQKTLNTIKSYRCDFLLDFLNSFDGYSAIEYMNSIVLYSQKDKIYYYPFYTAVFHGTEYHIVKENDEPYTTRVVIDKDEWGKYFQVFNLFKEVIDPGEYLYDTDLDKSGLKGIIFQLFGAKIFENIVIPEDEYINNFKSKHFEKYIIHNPCHHKKMCVYKSKLPVVIANIPNHQSYYLSCYHNLPDYRINQKQECEQYYKHRYHEKYRSDVIDFIVYQAGYGRIPFMIINAIINYNKIYTDKKHIPFDKLYQRIDNYLNTKIYKLKVNTSYYAAYLLIKTYLYKPDKRRKSWKKQA